jgi:monovalent cation:H+ antiporter-2, CPA2 family
MDGQSSASLLVELGTIIVVLGVVARLGTRIGLSPIPFYLLAGLAFGEGGLVPLVRAEGFVDVAGQIGAVLLMLMLGLEYTAEEFRASMREATPAGAVNFVLNFFPGAMAGLALGWSPLASVFLGGVTLTTSSGVMAKMLSDLGRLGNRETPVVLSVSVLEDLTMALYLPMVAVLAAGTGVVRGVVSFAVAIAAIFIVLAAALRYGERVSRFIHSPSSEVLLLTVLGITLVMGGLAEAIQVSAAIAAFLVGIALSGPVADQARDVLTPLRDLFAAVFFVLFGLRLDPSTLPPALGIAVLLAVVTAATKMATGWWAARRAGIGPRGRRRAGAALIPRGEFAILIATLGVTTGVESRLGPISAAYVMILAVAAPVIARFIDPGPARPTPRPAGDYPGPA